MYVQDLSSQAVTKIFLKSFRDLATAINRSHQAGLVAIGGRKCSVGVLSERIVLAHTVPTGSRSGTVGESRLAFLATVIHPIESGCLFHPGATAWIWTAVLSSPWGNAIRISWLPWIRWFLRVAKSRKHPVITKHSRSQCRTAAGASGQIPVPALEGGDVIHSKPYWVHETSFGHPPGLEILKPRDCLICGRP